MPTIAFYCQKRFDGGIRTGIGIDDKTLLHHFDAGDEARDPALLWFVDVRCTADRLPIDADRARQWLSDHAEPIGEALCLAAERLALGSDGDQPVRQTISLARGVKGEIVASAVRRLGPGEFAAALREVALTWRDLLNRLEPLVAA